MTELKKYQFIYTILRHVSKSEMLRVIDVVIFENNEPCFIGYEMAQALGWKWDTKHRGIKVSGCGMDMGFHLVYSYAALVYKDGNYLKQRWL